MTAVEIATICISAGTLGMTLFLTYHGYKQNEKLANLQAELYNVNKKLELEQQFILEKKKYLFEIKIKTINETIELLSEMSSKMMIIKNKKEQNENICTNLEDFNNYIKDMLKLEGKIQLYFDSKFYQQYVITRSAWISMYDSYMNRKTVDNKFTHIAYNELDKFIGFLNNEQSNLCNEK